MKDVELVLDASYEVKYEKYTAFQTSMFQDVYRNASEMVREIIEKNLENKNDQDDRFRKGEQICNVIAFLGKRGSGKSSALASYCKFLDRFHGLLVNYKDTSKESMDAEVKELLDKGKDNNISFTVLDTMDATLLDNEEKIVEIVLARMMETVENRERDLKSMGSSRKSEDERRALITEIGKIYRNLSSRRKEEEESASVLQLKELSYSWNVRDAFKDLVNKFNQYMCGEDNRRQADSNYIVIPIDDIDMNVTKCREMLEMIRKYLMVPRVIILLTLNFEQLNLICRHHHYSELFSKYGYKGYESLNQKDKDQIQELTREYMDKVIPIGRKIYMPNLYQMASFQNKRVLVKGNYLDGIGELKLEPQKYICAALRYYTGVVCLEEDQNKYLYPISIRRLCNYMKEFYQLKRIVDVGEDIAKNFGHNIDWLYYDVAYRFLDQYVEEPDLRELKDYLDETPEKQERHLAKYLDSEFLKRGKDRENKGEYEIICQILQEKAIVYGNQLKLLYIARRCEIVRNNALFAWHMFLSIKMTRDFFENHSGKAAVRHWGNLDNWAWTRDGSQWLIMKRNEGVSEVIIDSALSEDPKDRKKELEKDLLVYSVMRLFFVPEKEEPIYGNKTELPGIRLELAANTEWQFCMGAWLFCLWNYDDLLDEIEEEFWKQCSNQGVEKAEIQNALRQNMCIWREKWGQKKISPYSSSLFMEQVINEFYGSRKRAVMNFKEEVKAFLDCVERGLKKLDQQTGESGIVNKCEDRKSELCFGKCQSVFLDCPIVRFLKEDVGEKNGQQAYDAGAVALFYETMGNLTGRLDPSQIKDGGPKQSDI